jgi:hypothetical protein
MRDKQPSSESANPSIAINIAPCLRAPDDGAGPTEFFTKFARPYCAVSGKRVLGWGYPQSSTSDKNRRAEGETDLARGDQQSIRPNKQMKRGAVRINYQRCTRRDMIVAE